MANGYIPAAVERGCDPCSQVNVENKAYLGGVLGIDVNGERQPVSEGGIVDLTFIEEETREAAEQAIASAQAAAESEQTASEAAASARSSESAAQTAANAAEAAKADAEDAASSANASKNTADSYATAAQTAAAAAQVADGNAERSAESAIAAAAQAASSAGSALSSANDAYTSASTAQTASGAAQDAQTAAEASASTASSAATTATQAKDAAQAAQAGAEAAQSAAASSATAASGSATAAAGSATQAAASATAADASAAAAAQSAATLTLDATLTSATQAAQAKAVGDNISELKTQIINSLALDTSDKRNGYVTKEIGTVASFKNSTATVSINKIIRVFANQKYDISVTNSASPASTNPRDFVVVDDDNIIRGVFTLTTTASTTNKVTIISPVDGWLILCVDKNYTNIDIKGYAILYDIDDLKKDTKALQKDVMYKQNGEYNNYSGTSVTIVSNAEKNISGFLVNCPPVQSGSGTPTPSNVREISAPTGADFTVKGTPVSVVFSVDGDFYGGVYDYVRGILTANWKIYDLVDDFSSGWQDTTIDGRASVRHAIQSIKQADTMTMVMCSHYPFLGNTTGDAADVGILNRTGDYYNLSITDTARFGNVTEFLSWAQAQKTNGTPVKFAFAIDAKEFQLDTHSVSLASGSNTFTAAYGLTVQIEASILDLAKKVNPFIENTPFSLNKVKGKYISHIGVYQNNDIIVPCQSIADVMRAKRLGFNAMELNARKTSDGKYICVHGSNGAFGAQFTDANGDSVSDVLVSSMTLQEIKAGIRFKSEYAKYRTAPFTLQEMLYECKKQGIIPLVEWQNTYTDEIAIIDEIMGRANYMIASYAYDRESIGSEAPMYSYLTNNTAPSIISKANKSGGAYVVGLNVTHSNFSSFAESDWKEIVNAVHAAGYMLAYAYAGEPLNQLLLNCGFDVVNSSGNTNEVENANVADITDSPTFAGLTTTGTVANGVLTLANGNTVAPAETINATELARSSLHITFDGEITLVMGHISNSFTSDGITDNWFSTYYEEAIPTFLITSVGGTVIKSLSFKAEKV